MLLRLLLIVLLPNLSHLAFANETKKPDLNAIKVTETLYVIDSPPGMSANIGVVIGDDGLLIIDPGSRDKSFNASLNAEIRKISKKPYKYVVNTHNHRDHNGGNTFFAEMGATIISQKNIRYLNDEDFRYKATYDQLLFDKELNVDLGSEKIVLHHVMSHTANDVIVYIPGSNAVFTGDNHSTVWGPNLRVGGLKNQSKVINFALSLADQQTTIVPGHGHFTDRRHLSKYQNLTTEWADLVRKLHKLGITAQNIASHEDMKKIATAFQNGRPSSGSHNRIQFVIDMEKTPHISITQSALKAYIGNYQLNDGSIVEIKLINEHLFATVKGEFIRMLYPVSTTQFNFYGFKGSSGSYEFTHASNGSPAKINYTFSGDTITGTRE